ncbi:MAG TPA: 2'-5' RNA ligase family protein [archaeon]|nr:2'-5' RNA ligase family protein [archaeon]
MEYCLFFLHNKEIDNYRRDLVCAIANEFGLMHTKKANNYAHFTLKYKFKANTKQLEKLKETLSKFSKTHTKQKIKVGGFDNFHKRVVFVKGSQSQKINNIILELHKELKKLKWLTWHKNIEDNGIHLHTTITEECNEKLYPKIMKFLKGKEKYFDSYFDNITIMKYSTAKKPTRRCVIEKTYKLQ